jgi:hypothetical protein
VSMVASEIPAVAGTPCSLVFVVISFVSAWVTLGHVYRQPGGQRPPRTPVLGGLISLVAATPGLAALLWTVANAIDR